MRIFELFEEGPIDDLLADLSVLLISVKSKGLTNIRTDAVVDALNRQGYSTTPEDIIGVLKNNPLVKEANEETITLHDGNEDSNDEEESEDHVSDLAQQAVDKEM